jgi:hypothetical protein
VTSQPSHFQNKKRRLKKRVSENWRGIVKNFVLDEFLSDTIFKMYKFNLPTKEV